MHVLARRLRDAAPEFAGATCLAIACPACMTVELAKSCAGYVTTIVNNTDIVPTISPGQHRPPPSLPTFTACQAPRVGVHSTMLHAIQPALEQWCSLAAC